MGKYWWKKQVTDIEGGVHLAASGQVQVVGQILAALWGGRNGSMFKEPSAVKERQCRAPRNAVSRTDGRWLRTLLPTFCFFATLSGRAARLNPGYTVLFLMFQFTLQWLANNDSFAVGNWTVHGLSKGSFSKASIPELCVVPCLRISKWHLLSSFLWRLS